MCYEIPLIFCDSCVLKEAAPPVIAFGKVMVRPTCFEESLRLTSPVAACRVAFRIASISVVVYFPKAGHVCTHGVQYIGNQRRATVVFIVNDV
jgi:hypothetical protein